MKPATLTGQDLNRAVAMSLGLKVYAGDNLNKLMWSGKGPPAEFPWYVLHMSGNEAYFEPLPNYAGDITAAWPIIVKSGINIFLRYASRGPNHVQDVWDALIKPEFYSTGRPDSGVKKEAMASGPDPITAALRCFVASVYGDEINLEPA